MRIVVVSFLVFAVFGSAEASFLSSKKKAMDAEGNCTPELVTENARLYGEIEALDQIAVRAETQLRSPVKESQKLGFQGLRELSDKAKATRASIKKFGDAYGNVACKAQLAKSARKADVVMLQVAERVATLDKFAAQFEKIADDFLKSHIATK